MHLKDNKGQLWVAHFRHLKIDHKLITTAINGPNKSAKWASFCTLHKGPCKAKARPCLTIPAIEGKAWCNPKDVFSRYTGRKLAFARAVMLAFPNPDHRKMLADQYFEQKEKVKATRGALWESYWAHWMPPEPPSKPQPVLCASDDIVLSAKSA